MRPLLPECESCSYSMVSCRSGWHNLGISTKHSYITCHINNRQMRLTDRQSLIHWIKSHIHTANHTRLRCKHPSAWDAEHLNCKQSCQFQMHQARQRLTCILSVQHNIRLLHAVSSYMPHSQTSSCLSMICACSSFPLHKSQSRSSIWTIRTLHSPLEMVLFQNLTTTGTAALTYTMTACLNDLL